MNLAYEEVNYLEKDIKLCPYCNLVLRQKDNGDLYCISDKCSKKTKGFFDVKPLTLNENIFVLKHSVAYSIYYFGMLEQDIKKILDKNNIKNIINTKIGTISAASKVSTPLSFFINILPY